MKYPLLAKALAIGLVMAVLGAVLARIEGLVGERRMRQSQAMQGVEQSLAGAQQVMGPILYRACTEEWTAVSGAGKYLTRTTDKREFELMAVPSSLEVTSDARSEARYRGLFKVNTYHGPTVLQARWDNLAALQPQRQVKDSRLTCNAVLMVNITDVRGVRGAQIEADGQALAVLPATTHVRLPRGIHADLTAERMARADAPLTVRVSLELAGTSQLSLIPAAQQTRWSVKSDWPHPSFGGRFLPAARNVRSDGFDAQWSVSALASTAAADAVSGGVFCQAIVPGAGEDEDYAPAAQSNTRCLEQLRVAFIDPVNPYVLTDRATKYALMFIVLTFTCVALVEAISRRRVHPVQYGLVGLALAMFYVLLLSLSEHIGFAAAYLCAASACALLLAFYAASMLASCKGGLAFGAGVGALYGFLWVLLSLEQASLLVGSLLLFGALAAVMVLTRKFDWYALAEGWRVQGPSPVAPEVAPADVPRRAEDER